MQPEAIDNFDDLERILGASFVVLCGSAISGGYFDKDGKSIGFAPLVSEAIKSFFELLHEHLGNATYLSKVLSNYCLSFARGKHENFLYSLKFEDFIWYLEALFQTEKEEKIAQLLRYYYSFDQNHFLHNHGAIGRLYDQGRIKISLTTNFDNAIEHASKVVMSSQLDKKVHKKGFSLRAIPPAPTLLKLHGDVEDGSYIATTPGLVEAETTKSFSYLVELLSGQTVLLAGYSGQGDIDVAPFVREAKDNGAKIIQIRRPKTRIDPFSTSIATHYFESDLYSTNPQDNWLLRIADEKRDWATNLPQTRQWQSHVLDWIVQNITLDHTRELIERIYGRIDGLTYYHFYMIDQWDNLQTGRIAKSIEVDVEHMQKCVNMGTYFSGKRIIKKIDSAHLVKKDLFEKYYYLKGFILWRMVHLEEALDTLRYFVALDDQKYSNQYARDGLTTYIEVATEMIKDISSPDARMSFYQYHQLDFAIQKLQNVSNRFQNPTRERFVQVMIMNLKREIGESVDREDYREYFQWAYDMQQWGLALTCAASLMKFSIKEGTRKIWRGKIRKGHKPDHLRKTYIYGILDVANTRYKKPSIAFRYLYSRIKGVFRELRAEIKIILWKREYSKY